MARHGAFKYTDEQVQLSECRQAVSALSVRFHTLMNGEPIYNEETGKLLKVRNPQPGKARRLLRAEHKRLFGHSGFGMHIKWIHYRVLCVMQVLGLEEGGMSERITKKLRQNFEACMYNNMDRLHNDTKTLLKCAMYKKPEPEEDAVSNDADGDEEGEDIMVAKKKKVVRKKHAKRKAAKKAAGKKSSKKAAKKGIARKAKKKVVGKKSSKKSAPISGRAGFVVEKAKGGVRVMVKGDPKTEEIITLKSIKKSSLSKVSYAYTDKHIGPRKKIGQKGAGLSKKIKAVLGL